VTGQRIPLPEDIPVMAECFQEAGYDTFGITGPSKMGSEWGYERGFNKLFETYYYKLNSILSNTRFPEVLDDGAAPICREARRLSKESEPFFMYLNFMDAHAGLSNKSMYNQEIHSVPNTWHSGKFDNWKINVEGVAGEYKPDIQNYRELYATAIEYLNRKVSSLIRDIDE